MVKSAKEIAYIGIAVALLICSQLALSAVSGIEVVTAIFTAYCFVFGVFRGVLTATVFSLVRCVIFGFFPQVVVLYLIYYNIFVLVFGFIGKLFKHEYSVKKHIIVLFIAVIMTALFTMTDNILTPLMYSFTAKAAKVYFVASLYTVIPQLVCTFATVVVLFPVLLKIVR